MIFLFLGLILGDFSYTAPAGKWLDYARSGPISEHRFLVFERNGSKGTYDQGSLPKILDQNGHFLYEIPAAANGWLILNNVCGNEDVFLYQDHGQSEAYLWCPQFKNPTPLGIQALLAGRNEAWAYLGLDPTGRMAIIITKVARFAQKPMGPMNTIVRLLELNPDIANANRSTDQPVLAKREMVFEEDFAFEFSENKILLSSNYFERPGYMEIDMANPANDQPFKGVALSLQGNHVRKEGEIILYTHSGDGHSFLVLELEGATHPTMQIDLSDATLLPVARFLENFGNGLMKLEDEVLSTVKNGALEFLDLRKRQFKRFRLAQGTALQNERPDAVRQVTCNDRELVVQERSPITLEKQSIPEIVLNLHDQ